MSEVFHEAQPEFWRPPSSMIAEELVARPVPATVEACPQCGTEYLLGAHFCHTCGGRRPEALSSGANTDAVAISGMWERIVLRLQSTLAGLSWRRIGLPGWLRYLHFHEIQSHVGLSTPSLIAFVIGLGCVAGALLVGLLTARTYIDWQAIQFYRAEWLLAATAAFVAGILLKKAAGSRNDE